MDVQLDWLGLGEVMMWELVLGMLLLMVYEGLWWWGVDVEVCDWFLGVIGGCVQIGCNGVCWQVVIVVVL